MTDQSVRMLVTAVGYNEAGKQLGIKPATLRKRAQREKWLRPRDKHPPPSVPDSKAVTQVTPSHQALDHTMEERRKQTRAYMSKYAERAAREASTHRKPLSISRSARDVEAVRASLWPEQGQQSVLTLQVLNSVKVVRAE